MRSGNSRGPARSCRRRRISAASTCSDRAALPPEPTAWKGRTPSAVVADYSAAWLLYRAPRVRTRRKPGQSIRSNVSLLRLRILGLLHHHLDVVQQFLGVVQDPVFHHVLDAADALDRAAGVVHADPAGAVEHFEILDRILIDQHEVRQHARPDDPKLHLRSA